MPWYSIFTMKKDLDRICKAAERKSCNPESLSKPGEEIKSILSSKDSMHVMAAKAIKAYCRCCSDLWQCMSISFYIADRKYGAPKVLFTKGAVPWELFWTRPCFGVTNGGVETPKHMFLPYAVKSLTNNVELIQIINLFGHGVSYLQIEELNTTLCLEKLAAIPENMIPLPDNIKPYNIPTSLACDNIERLEETLSGEGTSHFVNRIAVQAQHFGP